MLFLSASGHQQVTQEIVSEAAEQVTAKTSRFLSFWNEHVPDMIAFGVQCVISLAIFFLGRFLIRWVRRIVQRSIHRSGIDRGAEQFIDSLIKFILYAFLLFLILQSLGVPSASIAAVIASAGVAVSLALQESLTNLAGGVQILLLKPFSVGDYIKEDSGGNEGTVEEIHIFYTRLSTLDNKSVIIPNGRLANNSLTNVTSNDTRLLELTVSISYGSDLKKAKALLEEVLSKDPSVLSPMGILIYVDDLALNAVVLGLRVHVPTIEYWPVRWRLLEQIKLSFDDHGIDIPYSQMDVYLREKKPL